MLKANELTGLFRDCIENKYVFNAVKEYVDWVVQDTVPLVIYGVLGLSLIAGLGYLAK